MTGPAPPSEALIRLALAKVQPLPSHVQQTADPLQAMQKAQTIGPARVGERYQEDLNPSLVGIARKVLGGAQRPASVAAEDPYGIGAWLKGAGPMPTPIAAEIQAYHGSPHDFEKFLLEKIGTGEGAQAYGHGLYFAENKGVAADYQKKLAGLLPEGWASKYPEPARGYIRGVVGDVSEGKLTPEQGAKYIFNANSTMRSYPQDQLAAELSDAAGKVKGKMYEVSIKADPDQFLDWDKPISQQGPAIRAKVTAAMDALEKAGTPASEYHELVGTPHGSKALKEAGIPGIKYLDQGSRPDLLQNNVQILSPTETTHGQWLVKQIPNGKVFYRGADETAAREAFAQNKPKQTSNYVVFDDKLIDILKKYAVAGAVGGSLASLGQQQTEEQK
jgi:hypothetical protein